jgi:hypothetical protein
MSPLRAIKIAHTIVWAWFAACIVALPYFALRREFRIAWILAVIIGVEVAVLSANRFRCPLTDAAAKYTDDRRDNFDIYLPLWLAKYNKHIFGTLFALGLMLLVVLQLETFRS